MFPFVLAKAQRPHDNRRGSKGVSRNPRVPIIAFQLPRNKRDRIKIQGIFFEARVRENNAVDSDERVKRPRLTNAERSDSLAGTTR